MTLYYLSTVPHLLSRPDQHLFRKPGAAVDAPPDADEVAAYQGSGLRREDVRVVGGAGSRGGDL